MIKIISRKLKPKYIFCYHRVIPEITAKKEFVHRALYVTPETFEYHMKWMLNIGRIVNIEDIFKENDIPLFMITFDDGWKDNLDYAYPILKKYNVPAIIFLSSDNIDKCRLFWSEEIGIQISHSQKSLDEIVAYLKDDIRFIFNSHENRTILPYDESKTDLSYVLDRMIEYLKRIPGMLREDVLASLYNKLGVTPQVKEHDLLLSWDEISFLASQGISFGSHTHTHTLLDRADSETIDYELYTSKKLLEEKLNTKIDMFSYPNGSFGNPYIQASLSKHGYRYAFTLERNPVINGDHYTIPRCLQYEEISKSMDKYYLKLILRSFLFRQNRFKERMSKITHGDNISKRYPV
jgi:peptidoglycan/xylan/chitin deacetylase (PgdA/CDA1 family)